MRVEMKNSSDKEFQFKRFRIPTEFVSLPNGKVTNELAINPPKLCPICGSEEVTKKFKVKSSGRYQSNYKKFITVLLCQEHKRLRKQSKLRYKHILFQFYRDGSIFSIKRSDWAEEFQKLNDCEEDKLDLELAKRLYEKVKHSIFVFLIVGLISIIGTLISLILQLQSLSNIIILLVTGAIFFFGIKIIYHEIKFELLKAEDFRRSQIYKSN
jgi:hypothetical protein